MRKTLREFFAKFSRNFREVFKRFQKFSEVFRSFRKFSEVCGCVQIRSNASWPKTRPKIETKILKRNMHFYDVFKKFSKDRAGHTPPYRSKKKRKKQSVSKMKVQVVTINSVVESSKSELSSRGKRPFFVFSIYCVAKRNNRSFHKQI